MILFLRLLALLLISFGLLGALGTLVEPDAAQRSLPAVVIFGASIAGGISLGVRAQKLAARARSVALNRKLVALAQKTGTLTPAQVEVSLSMTADEAAAALSHLSSQGLAQFDLDAEGVPVYRVQKIDIS